MNTNSRFTTESGDVLLKATSRAGNMLGLTPAFVATVIGSNEISNSGVGLNDPCLYSSSKRAELALLLVRIFRSLDPLVGGDDHRRLLWMHSPNKALGGIPAQLIERIDGLVAVANYLDGIRAASATEL